MGAKAGKNYRILCLFVRLLQGECIRIWEEADRFRVNRKSIQRDIADIRAFLSEWIAEKGGCAQVVYDRSRGGYQLMRAMRESG